MKKNMQICRVSYLQSFTAKIFITFLLCGLSQLALAQLKEDFSDNNFTDDPVWTGDDSKFIVEAGRLRLHASAEEGLGFLSTASGVTENAVWEFKVSMEFNPSSGNYARIYIMSDQADLSGPLNGFFVMVGGTSDEVSLYRQTGAAYSKIIDGRDGVVNLPSVDVTIRVTHDEHLGWALSSKITDEYMLEGTAVESTLVQSSHLGVICAYTSTRSDKFFFDDFRVTTKGEQDEAPPSLKSIEVQSRKLTLFFSEPLNELSIAASNFSVSQGVGAPEHAMVEADKSIVTLLFKTDFPQNVRLSLSVTEISDVSNNVIAPFEKEFNFIEVISAKKKDLIITEIFPDPAPTVGLPESEFIEILNRSDHAFNLLGWTITDQSSVGTLPEFTLLPNEYCVLTKEGAQFHDVKNILYLANFPSLNNGNDILVLADDSGRIIDSIRYFQSWYQDDDKAEGGWTLELIDPNNICSENENWSASEDPRGGTPGIQNSVFANKPDLTGPMIASVMPISATQIQVEFNEKLESPLSASAMFMIDPPVPSLNISFADESLTSLKVTLANELQSAVVYTASASNIYDCSGNLIQSEFSSKRFGLPEVANSLDIVINEILFNPRPTGVDFVEIINTSSKFINLKDWSIASFSDGVLKNKAVLTSENFLLEPQQIIAATANSKILKGEYLLSDERNFLELPSLPPFNDDYGTVALLNPHGAIIDEFTYTKEMHSVFLKDDEGVSLERISPNALNSDENWKSASAAVGFATPGYLNANAVDTAFPANPLKVDPEIFDPLAGNANFALIHFNLEHGGYVGNIKVFDAQGRAVKQIVNNALLGSTGFYRWDGDRDDGTKASVGYYMIWFEIFDNNGSTKRFQSRVAVATRF
jgi:hypothetical protein